MTVLVVTGLKMGTLLEECPVMLFKYDRSNCTARPVSVPLVMSVILKL